MTMTDFEMACLVADAARLIDEKLPEFSTVSEKLHDIAQELAGAMLACIYDRVIEEREPIEDMVGKHYNWHRQWNLDAANSIAVHKTGFAVRYLSSAVPLSKEVILISECVGKNGDRWNIVYMGDKTALAEYAAQQVGCGLYTVENVQNHIKRLMREAGSLWIRHLNRERVQLSPE